MKHYAPGMTPYVPDGCFRNQLSRVRTADRRRETLHFKKRQLQSQQPMDGHLPSISWTAEARPLSPAVVLFPSHAFLRDQLAADRDESSWMKAGSVLFVCP